MISDSSSNALQSRRKIGVNEVLAKLEKVKIQHQILRPPKSSIVPGCKIKRNHSSGYGKNHKFSLNKPVFIQNIEFSIESELKSKAETSECNNTNCDHLLCHQDHLDVELSVYRKAFDALLNKIMTFKPLLKRIKYIYDKSIEVRDDRIKLMDVLSSKLGSYKESVERKVETIQRTGLVEARYLRIENADLIRTIAELKLNLEERTDMVKSLRNDILELEEREIRRIVNGQRTTPRMTDNETDNQTEAVPKTDQISVARRFVDDPVLMSKCLQRARKDLSSAHRRLAEFEDTCREVVPKRDLERLEIRYQVTEREYRNLSQELEALMKEHEILKKRFEAVKEQKNSLRDRCKILAHTNTPRPDWSKCGQFIQGGVQRWRDITAKKSSEDRLSILISELCGVASAENAYFVGQGTDPSVPVFLRYKGKMKNRKLGRREVSILINDIWKNRTFSSGETSTTMGEYILKYFTDRYHLPLLRYEWIYNLYYACQRLVYDDQIGLFWDILWGNVAEDAYHVPRKEFNALRKMMEMRMEDQKINALLAHDIMDVMDTMYPYKSNRDIEILVYAAAKQLGIDPSTEAFDVAKLFAQTEEGWERGEFARDLARQTTQEITEFGKAILHSIEVQDKSSEVALETLKKGFMEVDEGISPALLTQHMKWIYKVQDLSKAKPMVSSAIVRQMLNGYIRISHPVKQRKN